MNATLELPVAVPPAESSAPATVPPSIARAPQPRLIRLPKFCRGIPPARNREIFRQVKVCQRTKTDVARQFDLSQPRVTQICDEVTEWMKEHTQSHTDEMSEPQRLNLAENLCRQRLETQYALAMEAFEASRQPRERDGWEDQGIPIEDPPRFSQRPQASFLNTALKATLELARLDGIWGQGDAWAGRNRQKLAEYQEPRNARWDARTAANEAFVAGIHAANEKILAAASRAPVATAGPAEAPAEGGAATNAKSPPEAAYERLWNSPRADAAASELAPQCACANTPAEEPCDDCRQRNFNPEQPAGAPQNAYAPPSRSEPEEGSAGDHLARRQRQYPPRCAPQRARALLRERLRKQFLAPLTIPPAHRPPQRIDGKPGMAP
jgi:hypothetical protein